MTRRGPAHGLVTVNMTEKLRELRDEAKRAAADNAAYGGHIYSHQMGRRTAFNDAIAVVEAKIKLLEIRDKGTFIPAMAIQVSGDDGYLMRRAGFGSPMIYLVTLATQKANYDPWAWGNRTLNTAHQFIEREWVTLRDGDVVDVEFILGETTAPKISEQEEVPA